MTLNNNDLVYVEWMDHATGSGWLPDDDVNTDPVPCRSIGWVLKHDKKVLVLFAMEDTAAKVTSGRQYIIKGCITKIKKVKV